MSTIKAGDEFLIKRDEKFWRDKLSEDQFHVLVKGETEPPGENEYYDNQRKGIYVCAACNNILFESEDKYDSGSGWPSFSDVILRNKVGTRKDLKLNMVRTEIYCNRCGGHLGHLFKDGPEPTGLRYCVNSAALKFLQRSFFSMGCFWRPDALFAAVDGVYFTTVGYAGGDIGDPTYQNLGNHAETVQVISDPEIIDYEDLINLFWENHDPTRRREKKQYRSLIFYNNSEQKEVAADFLKRKKEEIEKEIHTELLPLESFTPAEDYHQKFLLKQNHRLYALSRRVFDSEDRFDNSRIAAKLNAYNAGFLSKEEAEKELRIHYKYVKHQSEIEEIISKL